MIADQDDQETPRKSKVIALVKEIAKATFVYDDLCIPMLPQLRITCDNPNEQMKSIKSARMYEDDIILCAYPKSGNHWLSQVLHMLTHGSIQYASPLLASRFIELISKKGIDALSPPRILHTHLPLRMLPTQVVEKKIKCIQILRNPKDVCVSYFNHITKLALPDTLEGDFPEFTDVFLTEKVPYGSYYDYLLTWKAGVSKYPDLPIHIMFYEDMKADPLKCVKDLRTFLGLNIKDTFCEAVVEACSFDKLKMKESLGIKDGILVDIWKENSGGSFHRKGEVGDWKNWFTVADSERFDEKWNEKMNGSGIEFSYSNA